MALGWSIIVIKPCLHQDKIAGLYCYRIAYMRSVLQLSTCWQHACHVFDQGPCPYRQSANAHVGLPCRRCHNHLSFLSCAQARNGAELHSALIAARAEAADTADHLCHARTVGSAADNVVVSGRRCRGQQRHGGASLLLAGSVFSC